MQIQFLVVVQVPEREKYPEICASSKPISFTTNRTDNLFWMNEINTTGMEKIKTTLPKHNHLESGKHDNLIDNKKIYADLWNVQLGI